MSRFLSPLLKEVSSASSAYGLYLSYKCPGCEGFHSLPFNNDKAKTTWWWDGNVDKPTMGPSILKRSYLGENVSGICHHYVIEGELRFEADSTHKLAGKRTAMIPWTLDDE